MKKIRVKTSTENLRIQQKKQIKDTINIYIRRMIKDLDNKISKHHIYIEYYDTTLDLTKSLKSKKISNIIFNKKPRISKKHLIQKDKKKYKLTIHDIRHLKIFSTH